jgi:hypothetical protein
MGENYSKRIKNLLGASKVIMGAFDFGSERNDPDLRKPVLGPTGEVLYDPTGGKYSTPEATPDQKWFEDAVTGGKGMPEPVSMETVFTAGLSEAERLQRALLKMDVRDGKEDKLKLDAFDAKVLGFESGGLGFYANKTEDGKGVELGIELKF